VHARPSVADRAVRGHWDMIIGKADESAIGTLVECTPPSVTTKSCCNR
jgi:hypothetical protein